MFHPKRRTPEQQLDIEAPVSSPARKSRVLSRTVFATLGLTAGPELIDLTPVPSLLASAPVVFEIPDVVQNVVAVERAYADEGHCEGYKWVINGSSQTVPGKCGVPPEEPGNGGGNGGGGGGTGGGGGGGGEPTPPPTIPWERRDADADGVPNGSDACQDTAQGQAVDASGCSLEQRDDDADGAIGSVELFLGTDPNNPDTDADGKNDGSELYEPDGVTIRTILDADADTRIDAVETAEDVDGDGTSPETGDDDEANPCVPNAEATNCDADDDGLTHAGELEKGTSPTSADTDGDGVGDALDAENRVPNSNELVDADGVVYPAPTTTSMPVATPAPTDTQAEATVLATTAEEDVDPAVVTPVGEPGSPEGTGTSYLIPGVSILALLAGVLASRRGVAYYRRTHPKGPRSSQPPQAPLQPTAGA
jgi:hypothetical protein